MLTTIDVELDNELVDRLRSLYSSWSDQFEEDIKISFEEFVGAVLTAGLRDIENFAMEEEENDEG